MSESVILLNLEIDAERILNLDESSVASSTGKVRAYQLQDNKITLLFLRSQNFDEVEVRFENKDPALQEKVRNILENLKFQKNGVETTLQNKIKFQN